MAACGGTPEHLQLVLTSRVRVVSKGITIDLQVLWPAGRSAAGQCRRCQQPTTMTGAAADGGADDMKDLIRFLRDPSPEVHKHRGSCPDACGPFAVMEVPFTEQVHACRCAGRRWPWFKGSRAHQRARRRFLQPATSSYLRCCGSSPIQARSQERR